MSNTSQVLGLATRVYRVEVWARDGLIRCDLPIDNATAIPVRLFFLQGELDASEVERLCAELLVDPVTEDFTVDENHAVGDISHTIDVTLLPGVTDPAAENLLRAAHLLGMVGLERAATGERYLLRGELSTSQLETLATEVFSNVVIQRYSIDDPISAPFVEVQQMDDTVEVIRLRAASDDELEAISLERRLSLDLAEMRAIRDYFAGIDRDPTDAELEMLAQTWSEHCVHKTFKAKIIYTGPAHRAPPDSEPVEQHVDGLLKTYIRAATEKVNKPWVRSAFVDNAGIIKFDDTFDLAFKVETHNRPSAIEPFGGANTGVGGVVRDVLGVSARPIANTDILCFGPPDLPRDSLPEGVLHPNRIAAGVVSGIEDYGNKMGIPTVNGSIFYHPGYISNPLVFCGCLGILPHGSHRTGARAGDLIVVIGGRTGRDGLRGATFSSMEMDATTSTVSGGAVQIGHPIHEKQVKEVVLRARDEGLYNAITDCGAGGLSSAVGEMGADVGAAVQLNTVPLKYPGLQPWEIWLSEAQERMVLAVPPRYWPRLQTICAGQDVEAVAIGTFEPTGRLTLHYGDKLVGDVSMAFLHDGIPQREMEAVWSSDLSRSRKGTSCRSASEGNLSETLLRLLAIPTIRSKEDVIRRYDHEVQGGSAVKPLVGVDNHGPSDAAVIVPLETQHGERPTPAVAISNGLCPQYGEIDPYAMAWAAVDEAIRNQVAVGADPDQIAILDNFSWGNTNLPDRLGALVRCAQGCYDAAVAYGVPFISGKDSLNNEYLGEDGERHAIPGTLVISAVGIVPDVSKTVTMDLKASGNLLYVVGETRNEMGGSHYNLLHGIQGGTVSQPDPGALATMRALHEAIQNGLVQSCHDVSEGGIAVALAEMCLAGWLGVNIDLASVPGESLIRDRCVTLFSESQGRFIVEVSGNDLESFEELLADAPHAVVGTVVSEQRLSVSLAGFEPPNNEYINVALTDIEKAWRGVSEMGTVGTQRSGWLASEASTVTERKSSNRASKPRVLILHANGTNRDRDAYVACELAEGEPEIVHVNQLFAGERDLLNYHMLVVPGGFSYGDDLGAGVLWALDLRERLGVGLEKFIQDGRPVLGICNGFQTLVKAGLLPGRDWSNGNRNSLARPMTLTYNERPRFECRWVYLRPNPNTPCLFTQGIDDFLYVPVAHGEGRVVVRDEQALERIDSAGLAALTYVDADGNPAAYPLNPNGSVADIAGLCNAAGNVFGLMPHPENHIFRWQHPRYHRGEHGLDGLRIFQNGIRFA